MMAQMVLFAKIKKISKDSAVLFQEYLCKVHKCQQKREPENDYLLNQVV